MAPPEHPDERSRREKLERESQARERARLDAIIENSSGDALLPLIGIPAPPDPESARLRTEYRLQCAELALDERDYGEAVFVLDSVLDAQPLNAEALWIRAKAHASAGDYALAVRDAEAAHRVDPDGRAWPRGAAWVISQLPFWQLLAS